MDRDSVQARALGVLKANRAVERVATKAAKQASGSPSPRPSMARDGHGTTPFTPAACEVAVGGPSQIEDAA